MNFTGFPRCIANQAASIVLELDVPFALRAHQNLQQFLVDRHDTPPEFFLAVVLLSLLRGFRATLRGGQQEPEQALPFPDPDLETERNDAHAAPI